jgi:hypothetical protein
MISRLRFAKRYFGDQTEEDETGGQCGTREGTQCFSGKI